MKKLQQETGYRILGVGCEKNASFLISLCKITKIFVQLRLFTYSCLLGKN